MFENAWTQRVKGLTSIIKTLASDARKRESAIDALRAALKARDEMNEALRMDGVDLERRIDALHITNRKWKEEVRRRDGTIEALMTQIREGRAHNRGE